jgi:acyl-CoA synthetase (AMP-forming)/AMP-acid ligase II
VNGNIANVLWDAADAHQSRICLTEVADGKIARAEFSYAGLRDHVAAIAGGLAARGIQPGDRVAILLQNCGSYVEAQLAIAASGAVSVPLNLRLGDGEHAHMLGDSGTRMLITDARTVQRSPQVMRPGVEVVFADDGGLNQLGAEGTPLSRPVPRAISDLCSLMYTSGTTGPPKAVMLSNGSWWSVASTALSVLGPDAYEVFLHVAPLTHGAGFLLLPTFAAGGRNVVCRSFNPAATLALLHSERVTGMFAVPTMIRMLLDSAPESWRAPDSFHRLYYAGSPIDQATLRKAFANFGGRLTQSFAQMESPMFFTVLTPDDHAEAVQDPEGRLIRSAGRTLPGVEIAVVDPVTGEAQPAGTDGEIVARAPQTMLGYWNEPDASALALRNGWLHTGDVGHLDDGYLFVVDRIKDMIVTGGSNVYAKEVEDVLNSLPEVRECAVIGLPDRLWGESVTAVLVPRHQPVDGELIRQACRAQLADYRVPKRVIWLDQLPRNAYGKVLKNNLRERFSSPA